MDNTDTHIDKQLTVALIGTGVDCKTVIASVPGWSISIHKDKLHVKQSFEDSVGRGTQLAQCLIEGLPSVQVMGIDIFNGQAKTTSTLLLKALEKALSSGADLIVVCVHSFNQDKAARFEKVCAYADRHQVPIVASSVVEQASYPSAIETVFGALSDPECRQFRYRYIPELLDEGDPRGMQFVLNGWWNGRFWGADMATVRLGVEISRLMMQGVEYADLDHRLTLESLVPFTELGFE